MRILGPFTLANSFVSAFFLATVKTWLLIMGEAWKWDLEIIGMMGHYNTSFAPKLTTIFLRPNAVDIQNRPLCG